MDRRTLLKGGAAAGLAAGAAAVSGCDRQEQAEEQEGGKAPAYATGKRSLKLVTTWPKNFPGLGTAPERFARRVDEATDGRLTVKVYAAGELVPAFEAFDAVSSGAADMYHGAEYYWQGKSQGFNFFTSVPFGLNAAEMNAWLYYGDGQELWDELAAKFNIKPFGCNNSGVQMGGWFNKEIRTLEDFKGLKIRMPGLGGEVMRRLGAAAVALPGGEIFQSLQTGAIDATEWVGPWNDLAFGFYRAAKYYYWPGFHEPGALLSLGINLDLWNDLSQSHKAIVRMACAAETDKGLAEFNARNADALRTLTEKHGVQLRRFSDEILTEVGKVAGGVLSEVAAADPMTGRIYESFLKARSDGMFWGRISEEGFAHMRRLPFEFG
ncbi:MAG: TRAP transporter substrate-binding protein [Alphaproteobacteria bacterium]